MTAPEERITETGPDAAASEPAEHGALTRHWDSLDGDAAALLGAVERNLDRGRDRGPEEGRRPAPLGGELHRPRLNGPTRTASQPDRPKRWITAMLAAAALTLPFATPAGDASPRAPFAE
ncbi:hypothetical protein MKK50_23840 [Methylobacterium sp. J-043]|uniref:hypothetical protein n=1 Tax=Methylorubrum TaxID=2282523 RepID=UPI00209F7670|nr:MULTISPECIES: hypothetical protein [Methylorubrum]MCJ2032402.1 hypothetical protein [Methylobacterium sp. J-043]MCP1549967.1 hypothetical protein [Methylorubrum zatmanii]MCP1553419.1 hypothetical protein [Methylorubrum extorquens]MCP1580269.1 hypothetical protein [Methylorubrum extorquens]